MKWLPLAAGAVAGFALAWLIHLVLAAGMERAHAQALTDQKTQLEQACADDKRITEEANHDLQENYDTIARKLAAQRLRPARCVVPTANATDPAAGGGEHAGSHAAVAGTTHDFEEYAADCEGYRTERLTLERFITETWQAKR